MDWIQTHYGALNGKLNQIEFAFLTHLGESSESHLLRELKEKSVQIVNSSGLEVFDLSFTYCNEKMHSFLVTFFSPEPFDQDKNTFLQTTIRGSFLHQNAATIKVYQKRTSQLLLRNEIGVLKEREWYSYGTLVASISCDEFYHVQKKYYNLNGICEHSVYGKCSGGLSHREFQRQWKNAKALIRKK